MDRRIGGLGGLAFIILTTSTLFLTPAFPEPSASVDEVADFVRDNASGIELQAVVFGLAALAVVVFGAGLHDLVSDRRRPDGLSGVAWTGVALLAGAWVLSFAVGAGVALYSDRLSDDSIMLGVVVYGAAASVGIIGMALALGGFALCGRRTATLPNWTSGIAAVGVALNIASLATYTTDSTAAFVPFYLAWLAFAIWTLSVSIPMLRHRTDDGALATTLNAG